MPSYMSKTVVSPERCLPATKVMFVIASFRCGGTERVALRLLARLRDTFRCSIVVLHDQGPLKASVPEGVPVHRLGKRARFVFVSLLRLIRSHRPDVVISFSAGILNLITVLTKLGINRMERPAYLCRESTMLSRWIGVGRLRSLRIRLYRRLYRLSDMIVCQSGDMLEDMAKTFSQDRRRLTRIPNPIDVGEIRNLAFGEGGGGCPAARSRGKPRLVTIAALRPAKRIDHMIRLVKELDGAVDLLIVGDGELREDLESLAADLGVESDVHLLGHADNPFPALRGASAYLLTSRYEGFPNAAMEAMACGIPVVGYDVPGGVRDLVIQGVNGILVDDGNLQRLRSAVVSLLDGTMRFDPDIVSRSVAERFDTDLVVAQYRSVIEGLIAEKERACR